MKIIYTLLFAAIASSCLAQCPNRINASTGEIYKLVAMVESNCSVKLNADTISSLNVYYFASADKAVTAKFELLKAKKDVGDTSVDIPSKVLRIEIAAPAAGADKIFAEMKTEIKSCSSFKVRRSLINYGSETAEIAKMSNNKKRITIY